MKGAVKTDRTKLMKLTTTQTRGATYLREQNHTTDPHADEVAELLAWAKLRASNLAIAAALKEVRHD